MRVLHVESGRHLYGGAQQVLYLLDGLAAHGITNILACRRGTELASTARASAEVHGLTMGGDLDLGLIPRLIRLIDVCQPDLVHLHSRAGADLLGALAAHARRLPVVLSRRVDNPEPRWVVAAKYRLYDRVIAISHGIGRVLLAAGLPPAKLRVVRSAVASSPDTQPCDRAWAAKALGLANDGPWLGVAAQLIPRKGHRFLLAGLPDLLATFPGLEVIFFGQGPLAEPLRRQIDAMDLARHVHLAGFRRDLPRCLPCLDLLVHPALMEGLGVALLQSAAAGVPIVATRVGGIPEAVVDGMTGRLVPPADTPALVSACRDLLGDPERRQRLGAAGKRRIEAEFSPTVMAAGNLAVYREILGDC